MTTTHNTNGIEYARIGTLRAGHIVNVDDGFTCRPAGTATVRRDGRGFAGLYIPCKHGKHFLEGQRDDGLHYIGITPFVKRAT